MKTFVDAIRKAERVSTKEAKFKALGNLSEVGKRLMVEMFSPYRVFGVKKYKEPKAYDAQDADPQIFLTLLDQLHSRELTGNAARDAVTRVLSYYTEETAEILKRVLNKDPKAGFSQTSINKIYKGLVPTFDVMLAQKKEDDTVIEYPCIAEVKYDGQRTIAIVENGVVSYHGRSGKVSFQWEGLFDDELVMLSKDVGDDIIVDSEVMGDTFLETINAKSEDNIAAKEKLKMYAFDIMTLTEWKTHNAFLRQEARSSSLEIILDNKKYSKLIKSTSRICNNPKELDVFYKEVTSAGGEGLIIKTLNGKYEWKRSKNWLKYKPVIDVDLKIVGIYEGRDGTKNTDKMGGFTLEGYDENGKFIQTNAGSIKLGNDTVMGKYIEQLAKKAGVDLSSVSNDEFFRGYVWDNKEEFMGRTVQLEAQEISEVDGKYSLRFPVVVAFRDDKNDE